MADDPKFLSEGLRAADYDRYISVLYAPQDSRAALYSLYAFNAEIAGIRDRIREALPGEVRLQWWRDAIDGHTTGTKTGHPLADALLSAIDRCGLPVGAFDNYLEARVFDLYDDPMPSRTDLEGYCGETAGALIQLAAMILDAKAAPDVAELAGHAGCAQAIAGLLRLLPLHRARGQCFVPRDLLAAAGTTPEQFVAKEEAAAAERAVTAMAALAREHLSIFLAAAGRMPQTLHAAFLPLAPVPAYLDRIARRPAEALEKPAEITGWRRQWLFLRTASRGW